MILSSLAHSRGAPSRPLIDWMHFITKLKFCTINALFLQKVEEIFGGWGHRSLPRSHPLLFLLFECLDPPLSIVQNSAYSAISCACIGLTIVQLALLRFLVHLSYNMSYKNFVQRLDFVAILLKAFIFVCVRICRTYYGFAADFGFVVDFL